jgi:hypothetical protein
MVVVIVMIIVVMIVVPSVVVVVIMVMPPASPGRECCAQQQYGIQKSLSHWRLRQKLRHMDPPHRRRNLSGPRRALHIRCHGGLFRRPVSAAFRPPAFADETNQGKTPRMADSSTQSE